MRDALRQLKDGEYWVYGPGVHEFDQVIELIQKYSEYADECIERMTSSAPESSEFTDAHAEVASDLRYYNFIEKGLLWSFALWRTQGMFEAMLVSHFLPDRPNKPLVGFKAKMSAVVAAGYSINPEQEIELLAWANLRNLLSHMPPEHYHPIAVDREDVEEYVSLVKNVCSKWTEQRKQICKDRL